MSLAEVQARIAEIQSRIGALPGVQRAPDSAGAMFASALQSALGDGSVNANSLTGSGASVTGDAVVADSLKYMGVPYKWGGTDPATGLDCSGFVQRVYGDLGVDLPRVAADQAKTGDSVPSPAEAKPGDLVAFGSPVDHIGIYVGDGKMIEAPHTGDVVKVADITGTPTAIRRVVGQQSTNYDALFQAAGVRYGLSPQLLSAVATAESGLDPTAVSPAGAQGLMQLMPSTASALGVDPLDPTQAVDGAARLLRGNLNRFGSVDKAVAAYNAGGAAVDKYNGVPPYAETQNYVRRVLSLAGRTA
ncbi:MAG: transglycosylase SLT domain-containing protein [Acidobacteria bacterium]|nr:transglycosylase SLT domain-containing protein [Acidobacteriota bacterium]